MKNKRLVALHRLLRYFFKSKQQRIDLNDLKRLEKYKYNFKNNLPKSFSTANLKEIKQSIQNNNLILVGDFHTFESSQNFFIEICDLCNSISDKKNIIALEVFDKKDQCFIDSYLNNKCSEEQFLENTSY